MLRQNPFSAAYLGGWNDLANTGYWNAAVQALKEPEAEDLEFVTDPSE